MNPENYCTLEYAKKLVDNGIVLETDFYYVYNQLNKGIPPLMALEQIRELARKSTEVEYIPAPCFTEVWRELPEGFWYEKQWAYLCIEKSRKGDGSMFASYYLPHDKAVCGSKQHSINPTNAAIDLLIWAKGEKK